MTDQRAEKSENICKTDAGPAFKKPKAISLRDQKSVEQGKRVDLGGRRIIKKNPPPPF